MHRQLSAHRLAGIAILVTILSAGSARADTYAVRLRWQPSPSEGVVGYRVYMRPLGESFGVPLEVGLPAPGPDGMMSYVMGGMDTGTDYVLAVSSYLANGTESAFSNELHPMTCGFLAVSAFKVKLGRRRGLLVAQAAFLSELPTKPNRTGVSIEITSEDGTPLYAAVLPPRAFRGNRRRSAFRYLRGRKRPHANGMRRLRVRSDGQIVDVFLKATSSYLAGLPAGRRLMLWLRLGGECASDVDIVCPEGAQGPASCV